MCVFLITTFFIYLKQFGISEKLQLNLSMSGYLSKTDLYNNVNVFIVSIILGLSECK